MAKVTPFSTKKTLNIRGNLVLLDSPKVMGVVNITPDSFYKESRSGNEAEVLKKAESMASEGAFVIDIGGYSSRPGAEDISVEEELNRVLAHIRNIRDRFPELYISIDTFRSKVAYEAIQNGADIVNDISGGELDPLMYDTVAQMQVPYVLMHMKGTPQTMTSHTEYKDLLAEMFLFYQHKVTELRQKGLKDIIIDPGFGFAKTLHQNYEVLKELNFFKTFDTLLLVGLSRKSMIYKALGITPQEAQNGTTALNMISLMLGADILRVHDVKEAMETVKLFNLTYHK